MEKTTGQRPLPGFIKDKIVEKEIVEAENEVKKECAEISVMEFIAFFLENRAIGKKLIINLVHPAPKQFQFIIKKIELEDAGYINERFFDIGDPLNTSYMIGTISMENDRNETLIFYMLENCFYFRDQEESFCEQCSVNGYPGAGCPFHMEMMSYHCPCSVSIELEEKILAVESEIAEV